jgi:signal peptidase I
MKPAIQNGDALWVKQLNVANLKVGDIVTLSEAGVESITHRVIEIEPLSGGGYHLLTRGDANLNPEEWRIIADKTVAVTVVRIPFGGFVLEFLASTIGRVLIVGLVFTAIAALISEIRIASH